MKNIVIISIIILSLILCSCYNGFGEFYKSDQEIANERLDLLLTALKNKDKDTLRSLFSKKAINYDEDFENSIDVLLEYFHGETFEHDYDSPLNVEMERDHDLVKKIIYSSYDVKTETQTYRIAIQDIITNTYEKNNVGIYSLYIIIASEDADLQYTYRGDGKDTPGINIGIKNAIYDE